MGYTHRAASEAAGSCTCMVDSFVASDPGPAA